MRDILEEKQNKIFILGAGASVDYGLPVWGQLSNLIKIYLESDKGKNNEYKKEILEWLDLIGEDKKYKTLDECIYKETSSNKYKETGQDIEFQIFHILKKVFSTLYSKEMFYDKDSSWIKILNEKIREEKCLNWNNLFFINYNYDNVLSDCILDFSYLPRTDRERIYRSRLEDLKSIEDYPRSRKIPCIYPHGLFEYSDRGYLYEKSDTINSHDDSLIEAVSCFHCKQHEIVLHAGSQGVDLYILGLGGGLELNLDRLIFTNMSKINNIYITVRPDSNKTKQENEKNKNKVINYLQNRFNLQKENIKPYEDCVSLVDSCFSDF